MKVLLLLVPSAVVALVPWSVSHQQRSRLVVQEVLKAPDPNERKRMRPRQPKKPTSEKGWRIDPSLAMMPVPLVPDCNGNWESLVSDLWLDVENTCQLTELKYPESDFARFRRFCDNYRTQRGTILGPKGRAISAQTRLLEIEDDAPVFPEDEELFKWTQRFSGRVTPIALKELDKATAAGKLNNSWFREEIMAIKEEPWEGPPRPKEDEDDEEEKKKEEDLKVKGETTTSDPPIHPEMAEALEDDPSKKEPEEDLNLPPLEENWSQLILQQSTPVATGVLRFPKTMSLLSKFKACRPVPRNVILGRLPPGKTTKPRSDLHNFVLTLQVPLKGCDNAGIIVAGEKRKWEESYPLIFDPTYPYSMYNDGTEDAYVLHVDFWHPQVTRDEKQMMAYFWMLWQQDKFHPSTRAKYTRRQNYRKELKRKEKEEKMKALKPRFGQNKKEGGGGGSIARK